VKIQIISVARRVPIWVEMAWNEYAKRFENEIKIELREVKSEQRGSKTVQQILQLERLKIEDALNKGARIIVLDERGKAVNTLQLAEQLKNWQHGAQDVALIIGGPDGLAQEIKQKSDTLIKLSDLTLPHFMVRVVLIEQLYRAHSINIGHPYHRN
jgi:23S rRNA (pseudouridine1915-N3)-methyltransferase